MPTECPHEPHMVVPHPTEPGKHFCRGCGRTGEIYTPSPMGVLVRKAPAIVAPKGRLQ